MYRHSAREALDIRFGLVHRAVTPDDPYGGVHNRHYSERRRQSRQSEGPEERTAFAENIAGPDQLQPHTVRTTHLN